MNGNNYFKKAIIKEKNSSSAANPKLSGKSFTKQIKTLFIFCPQGDVQKIKETADKLNLNCVFNNYQICHFIGKTVLFHGMDDLPNHQREFLLQAASQGARVEQLTSYLDKQLGYTEVSLLNTQYFINEDAISLSPTITMLQLLGSMYFFAEFKTSSLLTLFKFFK